MEALLQTSRIGSAGVTSKLLALILAALYLNSRSLVEGAPPKRLKFYMQDRQLISNSTGVVVAAQGGNLTRYDFGTIFIIDDSITETPSNTSKVLGYGQGMYLVESRKNFHLLVSFSAYFDNPLYSGTIVFHGSYQALAPTREIPILAGTGDFRGVHGHAIVKTPVDLGLYVVLSFDCFLEYKTRC